MPCSVTAGETVVSLIRSCKKEKKKELDCFKLMSVISMFEMPVRSNHVFEVDMVVAYYFVHYRIAGSCRIPAVVSCGRRNLSPIC